MLIDVTFIPSNLTYGIPSSTLTLRSIHRGAFTEHGLLFQNCESRSEQKEWSYNCSGITES